MIPTLICDLVVGAVFIASRQILAKYTYNTRLPTTTFDWSCDFHPAVIDSPHTQPIGGDTVQCTRHYQRGVRPTGDCHVVEV